MKNDLEHDHRLMAVVVTALQQPSEQRQSFLQVACHDDAQLYEEASETLEWEERMGNFLLEPLVIFKDFEKPFHPGEVISERFEIVREIGEGGMGVVYEAHDRKRNQRIAIKSAKTGFRRLLTPELQSALQVRHPNICLVNEIHTATTPHGEVDFLTMEFLDGEPLSDALSSGEKFSPKEALEIAGQLCTGLAEAHRSGIVHRDLKSANVILCGSTDGKLRAVITDFGLAGAAMSGPGELAGTPRYMAPELWQGEAASKASDIYALGVILYELVTGRQPFAENREALASEALSGPAPPSSCIKGLSRRWDAAILPCLDRSPSARPADAAMVLAQIQKKPVRKTPLVALALLIIAGLTPAVREPILEHLRPAKIRLAVFPATGAEDTTAAGEKILQNVSNHIRRLRSGGAMVAVTSPVEMQKKNVQTTEQAREVFHATHVLQVKLRRDGGELEVEASIVEVGSKTHLREFSGRYAPELAGDVPTALAGFVSAGLRLQGDTVADLISPAARGSYDRALYFLRRDMYSYDQAGPLFNEAARSDPHSPSPLAGLAEAQIQKFQGTKERRYLEDARRSLSQAETLDPDSPRVHLAAGLLNEITGQYGRALEDYQRVQDIDPGNVSALLRLARIYDAQNLPDKAIENCRKAIKLEPDTPLPYQQLGLLYYYHGKYLSAAEQFQKAVERDHRSADAYINLGIAMMDLGREAEAEQALLTSLTIREDAHALNTLGTIRDQQGREAEAAGYYRRAVALEPGNYTDWLNLGDSERRLGHLDQARAAYRKLKDLALMELQQNPSRGRIRAFVAYAKLRLGQKAAAEEEINEALHSAPGNSQVIYLAVLIYETLGQRNQTIDVLRGSTPEGIRGIEHERDLTALHGDPRFLQLVAKAQAQ